MEVERISSRQAVFLCIIFILGTAVIYVPASIVIHSNQDAWISSVLSTLFSLYIVWLTVKLSSLFPDKTFIEYLEDITGQWLGKVIGLLYLFFFLHSAAFMVRHYGDFITGIFLNQTPLIAIHAVIIAIAAFCIKQGLVVLARVNEIFLPIILFSTIVILLLALPEMNFERLLPFLDTSINDIIRGSIVPFAFQGEIIALAMIIPFLTKPFEARRIAFISILFVGTSLFTLIICSLATFGPMVGYMVYPMLNVSRVINIAQFIERFEPFIMVIWATGGFVKITFFITLLF